MKSIFEFLKSDNEELYKIASDFEGRIFRDIAEGISKSFDFVDRLSKIIAEESGIEEFSYLDRIKRLHDEGDISTGEYGDYEYIWNIYNEITFEGIDTFKGKEAIYANIIHPKLYSIATTYYINFNCFWFEPCYKKINKYGYAKRKDNKSECA